RHQPVPAPFETRFAAATHDYHLVVPASALTGLRNPTAMFFPIDASLIDAAAEPEVSRREDRLEILLKRGSEATRARSTSAPATLDGVLSLRGEDGAQRAFEISANPVPAAPAESSIAWWEALMLAFLGGIVLNAMPCVFPILSLKLLSLAKQAHGDRSQQLGHGLAYTAGVLASFAALGGVLLALRAGGQAVGWGFQLQSAIFGWVVGYLLFGIGLKLSRCVAFGTSFADPGGRIAG